MLQPTLFLDETIIFNEEEPVQMMYFLLPSRNEEKHECGLVLPKRYNHFRYVRIDEGNFFGVDWQSKQARNSMCRYGLVTPCNGGDGQSKQARHTVTCRYMPLACQNGGAECALQPEVTAGGP